MCERCPAAKCIHTYLRVYNRVWQHLLRERFALNYYRTTHKIQQKKCRHANRKRLILRTQITRWRTQGFSLSTSFVNLIVDSRFICFRATLIWFCFIFLRIIYYYISCSNGFSFFYILVVPSFANFLSVEFTSILLMIFSNHFSAEIRESITTQSTTTTGLKWCDA